MHMPKETIIVLDPEVNTQWTLKTLLESEGYNVITANTIKSAQKKFSNIELSGLITEYWIGHSSTLGVIRQLKKNFPKAYVMMLTNGDVQEKEYQEIINAGVDDFFLKPFPSQKILLHLCKGLNHHRNLLPKKGMNEEFSRNYSGNELLKQ